MKRPINQSIFEQVLNISYLHDFMKGLENNLSRAARRYEVVLELKYKKALLSSSAKSRYLTLHLTPEKQFKESVTDYLESI